MSSLKRNLVKFSDKLEHLVDSVVALANECGEVIHDAPDLSHEHKLNLYHNIVSKSLVDLSVRLAPIYVGVANTQHAHTFIDDLFRQVSYVGVAYDWACQSCYTGKDEVTPHMIQRLCAALHVGFHVREGSIQLDVTGKAIHGTANGFMLEVIEIMQANTADYQTDEQILALAYAKYKEHFDRGAATFKDIDYVLMQAIAEALEVDVEVIKTDTSALLKADIDIASAVTMVTMRYAVENKTSATSLRNILQSLKTSKHEQMMDSDETGRRS